MITLSKYLLSIVFVLSAVFKIADFENTVMFFTNFSGLSFEFMHYTMLLLIFLELILGFAIPLNWRGKRSVYSTAFSLLTVFFMMSIIMAFMGVRNCGCFGTLIVTTPWASSLKNFALLIILSFVKYKTKEGRYV